MRLPVTPGQWVTVECRRRRAVFTTVNRAPSPSSDRVEGFGPEAKVLTDPPESGAISTEANPAFSACNTQ